MRPRILMVVLAGVLGCTASLGAPAGVGRAAAAGQARPGQARTETHAVVDLNLTALATHAVLLARYPDQRASLDTALERSLAQVPDGDAEAGGIAVGRAAAAALLALRAGSDHADDPVTDPPGSGPGTWVPTPPSFSPPLEPGWGRVTPWQTETARFWNATKFTYHQWRPVTAIRAAGDGNPATAPDPDWTPLLVTPPYPDYVSAASTVAGAAEAVLGDVFGHRPGTFTLTSPGLPGMVRSYQSFAAAAAENVDARVWSGIHWRTSDHVGQAVGRRIGRYSLRHALRPVNR